jgi:hypothetical protein
MAADSRSLPTRTICATELHPGDETPGFLREEQPAGQLLTRFIALADVTALSSKESRGSQTSGARNAGLGRPEAAAGTIAYLSSGLVSRPSLLCVLVVVVCVV